MHSEELHDIHSSKYWATHVARIAEELYIVGFGRVTRKKAAV
jgi:hypothetical protein